MARTHDSVVRATHEVKVSAPAREIYRLLADLDNWPWVFGPFVHAEVIGTDGVFERVGMWTTSGESVEHWVALRRLDAGALRIDFRPEEPSSPLASMERSWVVEPLSEGESLVRLLHSYTLVDDSAAARAATTGVIDSIADGETAAVKSAAELLTEAADLRVVVTDTVHVAGTAEAVFEVLYQVRDWPELLPHVTRAEVVQDADGLQLVEIDTVESSGAVLKMKTARAGIGGRAIVYKQLVLPPIGRSHHVRWDITPTAQGVTVTSRQTVIVKRSGIEVLLGSGKGLDEATAFVRRELSGKVRMILDRAKEFVEAG
ncbi:SRPBCC family protein [Streptomyces sp. NPDC058279]|uniref:aromatase/cyclase n=1 Tax=Streptomyces sp. NPDC058279 TaxID=3346418 RepID=UPI0036E771E0